MLTTYLKNISKPKNNPEDASNATDEKNLKRKKMGKDQIPRTLIANPWEQCERHFETRSPVLHAILFKTKLVDRTKDIVPELQSFLLKRDEVDKVSKTREVCRFTVNQAHYAEISAFLEL